MSRHCQWPVGAQAPRMYHQASGLWVPKHRACTCCAKDHCFGVRVSSHHNTLSPCCSSLPGGSHHAMQECDCVHSDVTIGHTPTTITMEYYEYCSYWLSASWCCTVACLLAWVVDVVRCVLYVPRNNLGGFHTILGLCFATSGHSTKCKLGWGYMHVGFVLRRVAGRPGMAAQPNKPAPFVWQRPGRLLRLLTAAAWWR